LARPNAIQQQNLFVTNYL